MRDTRPEIRGHINGGFQFAEEAATKLTALYNAGEVRMALKECEMLEKASKDTVEKHYAFQSVINEFKKIAKK